jgi:integrase
MKVQNGEVAADRARTALSGFFAWAIGEGLCDVNPVIGTNRPNSRKKRDRVLSDDELKAIWASCRDDDYGRIIKLLILLGCRESEIAGMAWSELDLAKAVWTIPEERAKGKRAHSVALMGPVLDILGGIPRRAGRDLLFGSGLRPFSGFSCAKKSLDGRIAKAGGERLSPWRVHDLRHTVATKMGDPLGILPHIVDEVLGHVGTHKAGVAGVYNHATYWSEVCKAMMLWGDYVGSVVTDAPRKFATLQRG